MNELDIKELFCNAHGWEKVVDGFRIDVEGIDSDNQFLFVDKELYEDMIRPSIFWRDKEGNIEHVYEHDEIDDLVEEIIDNSEDEDIYVKFKEKYK
jgi:hypothetical protein